MTANLADLITQLEARQAALGNGRGLRTDDERADHAATTRAIAAALTGLRNLPADVARADERLRDLDARRAVVLDVAAELQRAIDTAPDWRSFSDARERDKAYDAQTQLRQRLALLHAGRLLRGPEQPFESLADLDAQVARWRTRRERAAATLAIHVAEAKRLAEVATTTG
jgi:hypothetical protein